VGEHKISIREYAEKVLPIEWRMPLMTVQEACSRVGWEFDDKPNCCGAPVHIDSFFGDAYQAYCETCGRFIHDVLAPSFGNSWVNVIDTEKIDVETGYERRWIAGQKPCDVQGVRDAE